MSLNLSNVALFSNYCLNYLGYVKPIVQLLMDSYWTQNVDLLVF